MHHSAVDTHSMTRRSDVIEKIIKNANAAFVVVLLIAPLSVLFSRLLVRNIPITHFVELVTSWEVNRIQFEKRRILLETADYVYFLIVCTSIMLIYVTSNRPPSIRSRLYKASISALLSRFGSRIHIAVPILILLHFGSRHKWRLETIGDRFLDGFGLGPTLLAILMSIFVLGARNSLSSIIRRFDSTIARWTILLVTTLILLPQTLSFGRQIGWNREHLVALNEYASATFNLRPLRDFSSTYTSLFPWVIGPVLEVTPTEHSVKVLLAFHSIVTVALLVVVAWLAKQLLGSRWSLTLLVTAVLVSPRRSNDLAQGFLPSISAPGRFLLPITSLLILSYVLKFRPLRIPHAIGIGMLLGITLSNNADIGIPLVVSSFFVIGLRAVIDRREIRAFLVAVFVATAGFAAILHSLSGGQLLAAFRTWSVFVRGRAVGGFVEAVPVWGVHQFALAIFGTSIVLGGLVLRETLPESHEVERFQAEMCLTLGLFGFLTFPYYLGQNGPHFVGGLLWLPLGLAIFAIVGTLLSLGAKQTTSPQSEINAVDNSAFFGPVLFGIVTVMICSAIFMPDPQETLGLHFRDEYPTWDKGVFESTPQFRELSDILDDTSDTSIVAYYGEYGNLFALLLKINSVYGVHDPMIAYSSRRTVDATCYPLTVHQPQIVYASREFLPVQYKEPTSQTGPCPGLLRDLTFQSDYFIRYRYQPSRL